jgi:hypothetical protein
MESHKQGSEASNCLLWEPAGKPLSVYLELDVVERLAPEIMRGFGLVPKRGAEVGGFLLGTIHEIGGRVIIHVTDFELIPCEYRRGPSFLLSENDLTVYEEVFEKFESRQHGPYPIGYLRSHTRDGLQVSQEDLDLCAGFFPPPNRIALLVKPFATRVSVAQFFYYAGPTLQGEPDSEFPFRSRELQARAVPAPVPKLPRVGMPRLSIIREPEPEPERPMAPARRERLDPPAPIRREPEPVVAPPAPPREVEPAPRAAVAEREVEAPLFLTLDRAATKDERPRDYSWIPIALLCLLLGVGAGYLGTTRFFPEAIASRSAADPYALKLKARRAGDNLQISWDRAATPIPEARSGQLEIEDGSVRKSIELDRAMLENGSMLYRNVSSRVRAKLSLRLGDAGLLSETLDWVAP